MKELPLTRGRVALLDDADFEWASQWKWYAKPQKGGLTFYACRNEKGVNRLKRRTIRLHRELLNAPTDKDVDHINGNTLDCQRGNLRICTTSENCQNRIGYRRREGFKGIQRATRGSGWEARIVADYKHYHLGTFPTSRDAARAYNEAAIRLHGRYARLNDLGEHSS